MRSTYWSAFVMFTEKGMPVMSPSRDRSVEGLVTHSEAPGRLRGVSNTCITNKERRGNILGIEVATQSEGQVAVAHVDLGDGTVVENL